MIMVVWEIYNFMCTICWLIMTLILLLCTCTLKNNLYHIYHLNPSRNVLIDNLRTQYTICQMRPKDEYARKCIRYDLPILINNAPSETLEKVYTHSIHNFVGYIKLKTLESCQENWRILNCYICSRNK